MYCNRTSPETIPDKLSLPVYFKQNKFQNYVLADREIPFKMVVRGLTRILDLDTIKETLSCGGFALLKFSQKKIHRDGMRQC